MQKNSLKVSIVIPAYNEHNHIARCLDAISKQDVMPYEVIVVDNKSTDNTAEIARSFPSVRVIEEKRQGVVYARDTGFNAANGDIIGRIDGDTLLPSDWVKKLSEIFKDEQVQAVSGGLHFYDIAHSDIVDRVDAYWRNWMANKMKRSERIFLYGSNMAIRRSAWRATLSKVCHEKGIHEDLDLALHMSSLDLKVVYDSDLVANVSARRIESGPLQIFKYSLVSPKTYLKHNASEHVYMYPIIVIVLGTYFLLKFWFRAFDTTTQKLTLKQLFIRPSESRVDPTLF
jgi:glycosyltransferase involved in cell wall biosynthesis